MDAKLKFSLLFLLAFGVTFFITIGVLNWLDKRSKSED